MSKPGHGAPKNEGETPAWFDLVRQHVASHQYGVVQIVVHDSEVIQIEKTERVRFEKPRPSSH